MYSTCIFSQGITVDNTTNTPADLVNLLLGNSCVEVSNISVSSTQAVAYFNQNGYTNLTSNSNTNKDQLLDKLNYMIHLLEEQKDEKTGHVIEEVILYSFLGIFIIFIVDSFARAGKYTR